jgi:hypothetical protein
MTGCIRCLLLGNRRVSLFKNVGEFNRLMALICGGLFVMVICLLPAVRLMMPIRRLLVQLNLAVICSPDTRSPCGCVSCSDRPYNRYRNSSCDSLDFFPAATKRGFGIQL